MFVQGGMLGLGGGLSQGIGSQDYAGAMDGFGPVGMMLSQDDPGARGQSQRHNSSSSHQVKHCSFLSWPVIT
jgi:hypothetical protein